MTLSEIVIPAVLIFLVTVCAVGLLLTARPRDDR